MDEPTFRPEDIERLFRPSRCSRCGADTAKVAANVWRCSPCGREWTLGAANPLLGILRDVARAVDFDEVVRAFMSAPDADARVDVICLLDDLGITVREGDPR